MTPVRTCLAVLSVVLMMWSSQDAQAAISCSVSSPGVATAFSGSAVTTQSYVTLNCTRNSGDPSTSAYSLIPDNGLYASGQNNRAALGANRLPYEDWQNSACSTAWRNVGGDAMTGTVSFGTSLSTSVQRNFWLCIPASPTYAAGVYTDTVTLSLTYSNGSANVTATGTYSLAISTVTTCSITSPPGSVSFSYTSFQSNVATATTSLGSTCSIGIPYTLAIDSGYGVISGLNYSLGINDSASGGGVSFGSSGTGNQQTFHINGTMPANQAGTCSTASCSTSQTRTLTISY